MIVPRASTLSRGISRTIFRTRASSARSRTWQQVSRRHYASSHGGEQSSELPWIIGSLAVFVPSAGWLLQQGPKKGDHGHGHEEHAAEHEEGEEEPKEDEADEKEEQPEEESKDEAEEKSEDEPEAKEKEGDDKDESDESDESNSEESDSKGSQGEEDEYEKPGPNAPKQINWHSGMQKGPGEGQKEGERKPTEKKGDKDAQGTFSGAKHPYIDDAEKSKKGLGVTETAKIHGTVDTRTGARGVGQTGKESS